MCASAIGYRVSKLSSTSSGGFTISHRTIPFITSLIDSAMSFVFKLSVSFLKYKLTSSVLIQPECTALMFAIPVSFMAYFIPSSTSSYFFAEFILCLRAERLIPRALAALTWLPYLTTASSASCCFGVTFFPYKYTYPHKRMSLCIYIYLYIYKSSQFPTNGLSNASCNLSLNLSSNCFKLESMRSSVSLIVSRTSFSVSLFKDSISRKE